MTGKHRAQPSHPWQQWAPATTRNATQSLSSHPVENGRPAFALSATGLVKRYGRRRVLDGVSFRVPTRSLVGIQGENGAGKSTLLKCLTGMLRPDAGTVRAEGTIGYCPQEPLLIGLLTVTEHLRLLGAGYGLGRRAVNDRIAQLLELFDATKYADTRIDRLSGGTKQKVNLIGAMLHTPRILLLDEPYQGFDYETYLKFWDYAGSFRNSGGAVLVVSHMHSELHRFDAMVNLKDGAVSATGPAAAQVAMSA